MTTRHAPEVNLATAALAPYAWRDFTPGLVARFVVAAADRESLRRSLDAVPRATAGPWEPLAPAEPQDPRLAPLLSFLDSHQWAALTLPALCGNLVAVLAPGPR